MLSTRFVTFSLGLTILCFLCITAKGELVIDEENVLIWCTVNIEEQVKCKNLSRAIERDVIRFGRDKMTLRCNHGFSKDDCMNMLDSESAHITSLDPGEVFVGGRYHSLVPIIQEIYEDGSTFDYAVAVVKKGTLPDVNSIKDLRKKKACFAGVGTLAGWIIPVYTLMKHGGLEVIDCNNHVKSTTNFFGPSCAVNSLINKYNPVGDNSDQLCQLCAGHSPGLKCTETGPYAGYEGAFRCLVEAGDIAFLLHTTVHVMTSSGHDLISVSEKDFELLCSDGTRRPMRDYLTCNWGTVPSHAIVTTSAKSTALRRKYFNFLRKAIELYGSPVNNRTTSRPRDFNEPFLARDSSNSIPRNSDFSKQDNEEFRIFESAPRYGTRRSLLFQDTARGIQVLPESQQTYKGYLKDSLKLVLGVYDCPVGRMTLCVTSDPELDKCVKMKIALKAQLLKPEMSCIKGTSQIQCMQAIQTGVADVAVFDAGDVYTAGLRYDLIPFVAEVYNLGVPEYYVVAVAKEEDPDTELTYLKGKNTCHAGMQLAAGWVIPMAYLISNGWIRSYGCDSSQAAAQYFTKSCIPGALSPEYNSGVPNDNMCHLCHGSSRSYCRRDASEDYFGDTGAFRCLVEGGGEVAFMKHTTVMENTDGKRREWWARNTLTNDFQLLCPDGRRASIQHYANCNLGKVKTNAIVARGGRGYNETELNAFINLFVYAQQFYGRKFQDDFSFSMFHSKPPYADLIFQDATLQLLVLNETERNFRSYLGRSFMRARSLVDCHAGALAASGCFFMVLIISLTVTLLSSIP